MSAGEQRFSRRRFLTGFGHQPAAGRFYWQTIDTGVAGASGTLWSVCGNAPDEMLIVGDDGVILEYDGHACIQHQVPTRLPLHAVWGLSRGTAFAVGWMGVICEMRDGEWSCQQGGRVDPETGQFAATVENQPLFGLWGSAADDIWAVGDSGRIVRFDGVQWLEQDSGVDQHLRGVFGFPDGTLLCCGMQGTVLKFKDGVWTRQDVGTSTNLTHIWARAADDVFAVGGQYDVTANRFVGDVLHYDGTAWRVLDIGEPLQRLRAVVGDRTSVLLTGDRGALYVYDRERFTRLESGVDNDLHDLVLFEDSAVAVGDMHTVLCGGLVPIAGERAPAVHTDKTASSWELVEQQITNRILWSVWGTSARWVFAVGEQGTIIHYDGSRWTRLETPTELHLHGIWGTSAQNVYAVGQLGLVLHYDGNEWREVHRLAVEVTAVAITGFGPHEIFAVGDEGLILVFDGAQWERVHSGTKDALYGVWGMDGNHVLAVGDFGSVLRWNGNRWDLFNAGTESFLYGVSGSALNDIRAVGLAGTAVHFDGSGWRQRSTRQRADLLAVAERPGRPPVAVGTMGAALVYDGSQWVAERTGTDASLRDVWMANDGTAYAVGDGGTVVRRGDLA